MLNRKTADSGFAKRRKTMANKDAAFGLRPMGKVGQNRDKPRFIRV